MSLDINPTAFAWVQGRRRRFIVALSDGRGRWFSPHELGIYYGGATGAHERIEFRLPPTETGVTAAMIVEAGKAGRVLALVPIPGDADETVLFTWPTGDAGMTRGCLGDGAAALALVGCIVAVVFVLVVCEAALHGAIGK